MSTAPATTTTKERILDAAEEIMLQKSFHSVGLNEILSAVKVPKGSFYHYFQSKEQFGVELLKHYVADASVFKRKALLTTELSADPAERLAAYYDLAIANLMGNSCQCSCLVAKLASEVATFSDDMRAVLAEGMREWRGFLEKVILEGQEKGVFRKELNAAATAAMAQDLWMGANQRMQVEKSVTPLRAAAMFIRTYLSLA
ncbi:MAG: TetR/AcrR family transcriptional regulator [Chthoniobacter sp.]|uniref:TetR/AcrR family transcriptional regulator n=1 Tax=Chthoniobacter sp. TaxID=2510640 RepID=UPI0032A5E58E